MHNPVVEAIKKTKDAVVSISISKEIPPELLADLPVRSAGGTLPAPAPLALKHDLLPRDHARTEITGGSGFLISPDGHVLTNKHVVKDASAVYSVILADNKVVAARVLSRDPINDIALLRIEGEEEFPVIELGDSGHLELGETVIAIGNALGTFQNTVSVGVISGLSRFLSAEDGEGGDAYLRGLVQTDAAINPGNSGGPLVNIEGNAIGINVATVMGAENIGFAIPINVVKRDLEDIKKYGRIRKPFLGVRYVLLDEKLASELRLPVSRGAYLIREDIPGDEAVIKGSPGEKAGLREKDIITEFNGSPVTEERALQDILEECEIGHMVALKYLRNAKEREVKVTLEERV
jgi:serine protease Do